MAIIGKVSGYTSSAIPNNWYSFTLATAQTINLDLLMGFGTATEYLYDASGNQIDYNSGNSSHDGWLNRVLAAGTYYVDVASSYDSSYTLTTSSGIPLVGSVAVDSAGGTLATARALGTLGTAVVADAIGGSDVIDYYSFNVASTSLVSIVLSGLSSYATVYLQNASGQTISSNSGTATTNASINQVLPYLTPGTYFVEVTGNSYNPAAGYNLSVSATPVPTAAGSTLGTARSMGTLGTTTSSFKDSLNSVVPAEYYSFSLGSASQVTLTISGLTDSTTLYLLDATGNTLAQRSGDYGNGSVDTFNYYPTLPLGTYYVKVASNLYNTIIEPYTLTAQATAVVDSGGNTIGTATPLGAIGSSPTVKAGYLGSVNLDDYYSFTLGSAATVNVHFTANYDEYLTLYSSTGAKLSGPTHAHNAALDAAYTLAAGTYYLDAAPATGGEQEYYAISLSTAAITVGTSAASNAGASLPTAKSLGTLSTTPVDVAEWVGPGNIDDWYTVTLASAGRLQADVSGNTSAINVYMLNATGNSIDSDSGGTGTFTGGSVATGASVWDVLSAGTYYVHVQDGNSSYSTGYHLSASVTPSGGGSSLPDLAGNTTATGLNIGTLGSTVQTFSDYVGATDPDDYFQFTLTANSTVNARLVNVVSQGNSSTLYLRDISGNQITYDNESYAYSGDIQRILAPGTYFFDVNNSNGNSYTLTMSATPLADTASSARSTAASFLPTAAGIAAQIDALEPQVKAGAFGNITLSDSGTPTISISYAQAVTDIDVLNAIVTPYTLDLSATPEKYAGATLVSLGLGASGAQSVQFSDGRLVLNTADAAAQVYRMYLSAFGRNPDTAGQHFWNQQVETGTSLASMAQGFIGSPEFTARYGTNVSDTAFVTLLYQNVLGRAPDSGGLSGWLAALSGGQSRAQVLVAFSESTEHVASTTPGVKAGLWDLDEKSAQVARLYDTVFGRIPDAPGLASWSSGLRAGTQSVTSVAGAFAGSPEFQATYGSLNNSDFVSKLYINALHRAADPAGLASWVTQLNAGTSRASVIVGFSESAEHQSNTTANVLNPSAAQSGVLASGPVIATGAVISANLGSLEGQVTSHAISNLNIADSGTAAVPITTAQIASDKDVLNFITGNFYLDMHTTSSAASGAAVQANNLGATTAVKYVQFSDGRLVYDLNDRSAQTYRMYDSAFGRTADSGGEHNWSQVLASGTSLTSVAQAFLDSAEFAARYGVALSDNAFVTRLYANVLHRAPDSAGLSGWLATLSGSASRAQVLTSFSESTEHIGNTATAIHAGIYDLG